MADVNFGTFSLITPASTDHVVLIDDPGGTPAHGRATIQDVIDSATGLLAAGDDASDVAVTPAGGISSTDVQAALQELDTEKIGNVVEDTTPQLGAMLDANGFSIGDGTRKILDFAEDASGVNYILIENQATGSGPFLRAVGSDTDVDLVIICKGAGALSTTSPIVATSSITVGEIAAPATPATGRVAIYAKTDGKLYIKDDAGTETDLTAGGGGGGDVVGPATATDEALARFDGTTGELLQDSPVTLSNAGAATGFTTINATGAVTVGSLITAGNVDGVDVSAHAASTAEHGATGAVVGTTNTQTLTNKTLTTPTIASFTNATHDHSNSAGGGAIVATSITNDSTVTGTTLNDALDYLDAAYGMVPKWATGSYYYPQVLTGINLTTQSGGSGTIVAAPLWVPDDYTLITLVAEVTTAVASQNCKLALYADSNGTPGALLDGSGDISAASTGKVTFTISEPVSRGLYWVAIRSSNNGVIYRASLPAAVASYLGDSTGTATIGTNRTQITRTGVSFASAWPDPMAAAGASTANLILVGVERS